MIIIVYIEKKNGKRNKGPYNYVLICMSSKNQLIRYKQIRAVTESFVYKDSDIDSVYANELIELLIASDEVITLINQKAALDEVRLKKILILLFEDKKQLLRSYNLNYKEISLDYLTDNGFQLKESNNEEEEVARQGNKKLIEDLNSENAIYFKEHIEDEESLNDLFISLNRYDTSTINERLNRIRLAFPNGIDLEFNIINNSGLNKKNILLIARYVYAGIIKSFPPLFFHQEAEKKIKYIIEEFRIKIFKLDLNSFFNQKIELLIQANLNGIARYCNYSWNRLIQIVYPKHVKPWQLGKVEQGYWDNLENRKNAVNWLIEDYYNIKPENIYVLIKQKILSRDNFGETGLSYLYNTYYNSMLKAISEGYPHLEIWKIGIYQKGYWKSEQAMELSVKAFLWLLEQEEISEEKLIEAVHQKRLNREVFSKYNLLTMFDYCYKKNLGQLIESTFPNRYESWELGNIPSEYWSDKENREKAINYFIKEKKLDKKQIDTLLKEKNFPVKLFKESKLSHFFKKFFNYNPSKIFFDLLKGNRMQKVENERILQKLKREQNLYREFTLIEKILYGFNLPLVREFERRKKERTDRLLKKRKRIFYEEK